MPLEQANITLGTAGHIDHGKTSLVRALTGCETDRLKEEKQRGMSIELGFAPCMVADLQVGIVDVPGHENFVKTMVAGATSMDGVLLVIAADDSVMPQTREHLDILTLLGLRHGMIALTKIDRVDAEQRELACVEIEELARGTFLEGSPIVPISNITGEGFDRFYECLSKLVASIRPKRVDGVFRLPVERAFTVQGYGTVVAGIPVSGAAATGDEVVLLPQGVAGRIKRVEVYCRTADRVLAGQCAALNIGRLDHHEIGRGDTLTVPGFFTPSEWYAAQLRLLPLPKLNLKNGAEVRFHTGTSEVTAALYSMSPERMRGGSEHLVQIRSRVPIVAAPGDHFILRSLSPVQTIGGGTIIESTPQRLKRNRPGVAEELLARAQAVGDERSWVEYCIRTSPQVAIAPAEVSLRAKILPERLRAILTELEAQKTVLPLAAGLYVHRDTAAETTAKIVEAIDEFHRRAPESPGIPAEELRQVCPLEREVFDGLTAILKAEGRLVERNQRLARPEHRSDLGGEEGRQLAAIEELFRQAPFHPPSAEEVAAKTGGSPAAVTKLLRVLREHGKLVAIEDLLFHRDAVARAREILVEFLKKEGRLESVKFKYLFDTTRKYALPLLDYFDRAGVTRRVGNTRFLK